MEHARLSASSAHRWMACPASIQMEEGIPDTTSAHAEEGSAAHHLAEQCLKQAVDAKAFIGTTFDAYPNYPVDEEMAEYVQVYLDLVRSYPGELMIEKRVDFSPWVPDGFGTSDAIVINDNHATIIDLKYGKGVKVDAEHNPQAMLYALGTLNDYDFLYCLDSFTVVIVQPRLDHISEWDISMDELKAWAEEASVKAQAVFADNPVTHPGEKQCRFCKAKGQCKAFAEHNLKLATDGFEAVVVPIEPKAPNTLTPEEVAAILPQLKALKDWASAVEGYAHSQLSDGHSIPGYKLVAGRSTRQWFDAEAAEQALRKTKLKVAEIYTKKLVTPTQAEKLLGKGHLVLKEHVIKPEGKPTVVHDSDKRPAILIDPTDGFEAAA
ncbi:DUF2800 domain-containing protein [Algicola sagamiensis]|uniref:DUF2800 domain-containing protein n=1 Tax=Algicola sagamiensis TaxID=163869 RepID=UPI0003638DAE|nr:DUF2800 domain-containing protein [Algicola sagamiensis]